MKFHSTLKNLIEELESSSVPYLGIDPINEFLTSDERGFKEDDYITYCANLLISFNHSRDNLVVTIYPDDKKYNIYSQLEHSMNRFYNKNISAIYSSTDLNSIIKKIEEISVNS